LGDVSGVPGLTDNRSILKIVSNMLGEEHKHIDEGVKDAVGEMTNMLSGEARKELSEKGHSFKASIPKIVAAKDMQ